MKRFQLKYTNDHMEREYVSLQRNTNTENVQLSFYFLVFLLIVPGIPALINKNYLDAGIAAFVAIILFVVFFWKAIPRDYVQFLGALIICSFNSCIFFLPLNSLNDLAKSIVFFRGYAFAAINSALLTRFTSLKQKIFLLIYAFIIRVTLLTWLDPSSFDAFSIIRSFYIDLFIAYLNFANEKKSRMVFKSFYEYREELIKFKELLSEYFPQSITVFNNFKKQPLFSNKAFVEMFSSSGEGIDSPENSELENQGKILLPSLKVNLRSLQVDKNTVREFGAVPSDLRSSDDPVYLPDVLDQITHDKLTNQKPLCFSASSCLNGENKSFEVVLTKIKWDGEDATAIILSETTYQEKIISLKVADAKKDQILATVSHELRTPLNGIIGILGMTEKMVNDEKVREYLGLCRDNSYLLLGLVNSLLDLNQVRQGKLKLNPTQVNVRQILSEVVRLFLFQCKTKGIYLNLSIPKDIPVCIYTDENRLKQILINLIGNALKFTLEGGISVELKQDSSDSRFLQISVLDTGIGIKEEDQSKLFKMYEKIEHGRSVNKNGVGLGLTISNTLACLLSNNTGDRVITVKSEVEKGSEFSFQILKDLNAQVLPEKPKPNHEFSESIEHSSSVICSQEELQIPKEYSKKNFDQFSKNRRYYFAKHDSCEVLSSFKKESQENLIGRSLINKNMTHDVLAVPNYDHMNYSIKRSSENKGTILVVDDNAFNLLVVENTIRSIGYSFYPAKSGAEAIEIVKLREKEGKSFEAILMDCQMPIMDGFETTKILKRMMQEGKTQKTPIIALTANNGGEDIKQCYDSGMIGYLSKPLFANALLEILKTIA